MSLLVLLIINFNIYWCGNTGSTENYKTRSLALKDLQSNGKGDTENQSLKSTSEGHLSGSID